MELVKKIAKILDDKKGLDVEVLKVESLTDLTEYLVIASGTSNTHTKSLAGYVEKILKEEDNVAVHHSEGYQDTGWIILDYGYILVNIFEQEPRSRYNLEKLWDTAERIEF